MCTSKCYHNKYTYSVTNVLHCLCVYIELGTFHGHAQSSLSMLWSIIMLEVEWLNVTYSNVCHIKNYFVKSRQTFGVHTTIF